MHATRRYHPGCSESRQAIELPEERGLELIVPRSLLGSVIAGKPARLVRPTGTVLEILE